MDFFKQTKKYKVKKSYLIRFLRKYWFIPSDVLQRGIEADVWDLCRFRRPILDIGVGNGKISMFIFRNHPQIDVGIDSDESGLESARETKKYIKILPADAQNLPFKDASFSTVVSNSTFEHIENDLKAVSEVARVLKKGGLFFLTVPSVFLKDWIFEYEKERDEQKAKDKLEKFNKRTQHLHYNAFSEWKNIFNKNNMGIVFYKYYFPKKVALFWYNLFKIFTFKINNRELWSYLGHSSITKYLPKKLIIIPLEHLILRDTYNNAFFTDYGEGAQLFMIAKKI